MDSSYFSIGEYVKGFYFGTSEGVSEYYVTFNMGEGRSFSNDIERLYDLYISTLEQYGLSEDTQIFNRFYVSDISDDKKHLMQSRIYALARKGAISIIQQPPAHGFTVSLLSHHIKIEKLMRKEVFNRDDECWRNVEVVHGRKYDLVWAANFCGTGTRDAYRQTRDIFHSYAAVLKDNGMTLLNNAIRTWVFVRDIEADYEGMIESRKAFFAEHGLTSQTRYIASTGIEGTVINSESVVALDAFSIGGLQREQVVRMEAPDMLPSPIAYGVTFDRGTRIRFGDRSHLYISGTASIDNLGNVLFPSNPSKQTERTLENINALLAPHGAGFKDMAYMIVYLKNIEDKNKVLSVFEKELPAGLPMLILHGAVCRPAWLVEIEGLCIIPDTNEFPPFF